MGVEEDKKQDGAGNNLPVAVATAMKGGGMRDSTIASVARLGMQKRISQFGIGKEEAALTEEQLDELKDYGYTKGFIDCLRKTNEDFSLRIWIIDNSLSMKKMDGYQITPSQDGKTVALKPCSRWDELRDCVYHHIKLSSLIQAPTSFRFLNDPGSDVGPQSFGICQRGLEHIDDDVAIAMEIMSKAGPKGITPLTSHINKIYNEIKDNETYLRDNGLRVAVILATDGLPSDSRGRVGPEPSDKFIASLKRLEGLPVWVLIRICTSDDRIVEFYNDLDAELELPIEVLDDYLSEASEICVRNSWLNYGLPLHRIRENGVVIRSLDFLDERRFTLPEIKDFLEVIYGKELMANAPDPNFQLPEYLKFLKEEVFANVKGTWSPLKRKVKPWVSIDKIKTKHGKSCTIS